MNASEEANIKFDSLRAQDLTIKEVAERWTLLYKASILVQQWLDTPDTVGVAELETVVEIIELWRIQLYGS